MSQMLLEQDRDTLTVDLIKSEAAKKAVANVPAEVQALGGTPQQGEAVAEAIRVYLLRSPGHEHYARKVLADAGFVNGTIDVMLSRIDEQTR
jgi:hypothetical protein